MQPIILNKCNNLRFFEADTISQQMRAMILSNLSFIRFKKMKDILSQIYLIKKQLTNFFSYLGPSPGSLIIDHQMHLPQHLRQQFQYLFISHCCETLFWGSIFFWHSWVWSLVFHQCIHLAEFIFTLLPFKLRSCFNSEVLVSVEWPFKNGWAAISALPDPRPLGSDP